MKKQMKLFFIACMAIIGIGMATSCAEDEGNYNYVDLLEFRVDTTGIQNSWRVIQFEKLEVPSRLVYAGDKSELAHVWLIYKSNVGQGDNLADTIATTENFSGVITIKPGSYYLEYNAIQDNGYRAMYRYSLTVEGAVGSGLAVFYEKDGHADVDMVKSPVFMNVEETTYARGVYSRANPERPLLGTPMGLGVLSSTSLMDLFTETDGVRVSTDDMKMDCDFAELFYDVPDKCAPTCLDVSSDPVLVNDGVIYRVLAGWGEPYYSAKLLPEDTYHVEKAIFCYGAGNFGFDELEGRFLMGGSWASSVEVLTQPKMTEYAGYSCEYMHFGFNTGSGTYSAIHAFMKNKANPGLMTLLVISQQGYSNSSFDVITKVDLSSCPDIADAAYFATSTKSPLSYYTTLKELYKITFNAAGTATASLGEWTCPAGEEITFMRMFDESTSPVADSYRYLLVATHNGTEGKVYVLEIDPVSGIMSAEPAEVHTGFGLVKDVKFKSK